MPKKILLGFLALLLLWPGSLSAGDPVERARVLLARQASVSLVYDIGVRENILEFHYCGGVFVAPQTILTAQHCIRGKHIDTSFVASWDGKKSKILKVVRQDIERDLALVEIAQAIVGSRVAKVSTDVMPGDPLILVGSMDGEPLMVSRGWVAKVVTDSFYNCDQSDPTGWKEQQLVLADVTAWHGNSGGGAFDYEGNLIGILVRGADTGHAKCENAVRKVTDIGGPLWGFLVGPKALLEFLEKP